MVTDSPRHLSDLTVAEARLAMQLATGEAQGEDKGCTPTIPVKIEGGRVLICRSSTLKAAA